MSRRNYCRADLYPIMGCGIPALMTASDGHAVAAL